MKALTLLIVLFCAVPAFANDRQWQDATVTAINSQTTDNGAVGIHRECTLSFKGLPYLPLVLVKDSRLIRWRATSMMS